ncbi:hypothetical protein [Leifsonia aquatica]|uniref:Uncharacterized protein n=1 Tax=Leifsonia aquatica TaxID=144185 RepID=A0A7W4YKM1_LEIAQ|nr:hypothetical protein [Leifsonia aquatica]MBB2967824.1 hypothetical protein [Leifsonia aquatica]
MAAALWGHADVLLTEDEDLHNEVNRRHLLDAQHIDMARRRWLRDPNATDSEVLERLRDYFGRHGWPTGVLGP